MASSSHQRETTNPPAPTESLETTATSPKSLPYAPSGRLYQSWTCKFLFMLIFYQWLLTIS